MCQRTVTGGTPPSPLPGTYVSIDVSCPVVGAKPLHDPAEIFEIFVPKKPHTLATAHSYYAMPLDKLYVRVRCSICAGSHLYKSGHYEPMDPTKWRHCPYCDDSGLQLIEATKDIIAQYVCENEEILKLIAEKTPNKKS